ncbi:hypothetical protein [Erwinia sp. V71]|uniref:hypothetical protein n=1 Tax=Erwinia sp. V71 TaxID=3369424 RepID=UPI003F626F13
MLAKIIACQPAVPGTAQLLIRLRNEQAILSDLTFTLCNNEQCYLQPDGRWSPAPHSFTINGGYPLESGSGFRIGASLLDPLLESTSQVQIQVTLTSGETRNTTLQLKRDDLLSSDARGQTGDYSSSSVLNAPEPSVAPVAEPVVLPEPAPLAPITASDERKPKRKSSPVPLIVAVLLVLLIAAGALWWFLGRDTASAPAAAEKQPEAPAAATSPATPAAGECSPVSLNSQSELEFVQNCVQQKLDSDKLLAIIQAAKEAKKCGIAQRLYANRAQGGDSKVAIAYAGEYDPKYHQPGECFKEADPDTAAYWYETSLQSEPDNQQAKARLGELRK